MKYRIVKIKSRTKKRDRLFLVGAVFVFFVCILLSSEFSEWDIPGFLLETHKRLL